MKEFIQYLKKKNTIELLELISFSQLFPENHSKNLRLEIIQSHIINNLNKIEDEINYDGTVNAIREFFPNDHREDPPETSFTENFLFMNGNNIVFPGIVIDSTAIVEKISSIVLLENNKVPKKAKKNIGTAMFFMLDIYNQIATENGLERYMKPVWEGEELYFPEEAAFKEGKSAISFSAHEIQTTYDKLKIENDVINEFLFDWENNTIDIENYDKNPLLFKPFIKYEDRYYLAMPTSQMYALDNFIINTLKSSNCLHEIVNLFDSDVIRDTKIQLVKMGWSRTDLDKKISSKIKVLKGESFWQFDENKIAYVNVLPNRDDGIELEDRANEVLSVVKDAIKDDDYRYFAIFIMSTYTTLEPQYLGLTDIKEADNVIVTGNLDLERITSKWKLDKLSLWKYAKSFKAALDKGLSIGPGYSILTYYSHYEYNHGSFFSSDEAYGGVFFDFSIQGNIIIDDNIKTDKHGVLRYMEGRGFGYTPVFKTDTYGPIYLSKELFLGEYKKIFKGFGFPVWIIENDKSNPHSKHFVDAVAFWLNELSQSKNISYEFDGPIEISISISEEFFSLEHQKKNESNENNNIEYELKTEIGKIIINIPDSFHKLLHRQDNHGERELMKVILESISRIMEIYKKPFIDEEEILLGINDSIPLGPAKMILTAISENNLLIDNRNIPNVRYISKSDCSYVLENVLGWVSSDDSIPEEIEGKESKIKMLVDCVNAIIKEIRKELKKYDTFELLKFLLFKHEAIVQHQEYRKLYIPARIACFEKYKDINEEYKETEADIVNVGLSLRCLIEFAVAEPYYGSKRPNNDDVDYLLALVQEMIYFGTVQDSIRFDIDDPKIGLLPSGRLGINKEFYTNVLTNYNTANNQDELLDYVNNFEDNFSVKYDAETDSASSTYYDNVDEVFSTEWGIALPEIYSISHFLAEYCLSHEKSFCFLAEKEFIDLINKETSFTEEKIKAYLKVVTLTSRGKIDKAPKGYQMPEIFPWRYNRKLSLLRKPLIKIDIPNEGTKFLWGARFMIKSAGNLFYQFSNASLRTDPEHYGVLNLIAKRNNIKGRNYRNSVFKWLNENTSLEIVPFEVKIEPKGTLTADKNYGDIDILAFDEDKRIIYSLECKNTRHAKIMYDFQRDLKNYVTLQVPKHIRRHSWLSENQDKVIEKFGLRKKVYRVVSMIISSYQLPIKFLNETDLPIYSFNEIKRTNFFS
ncbi:hypothetical protein [uncultured Croceitalea sp.]|uniref:hypothetical protein n=1 Tax=uncultured Croceitalea sp. TaxID=1798908 RepID=UPI0033066621